MREYDGRRLGHEGQSAEEPMEIHLGRRELIAGLGGAVAGAAIGSAAVWTYAARAHRVRALQLKILRLQVNAAANEIATFFHEIAGQVGWTTQQPWSSGTIDQRRFDCLRLLREVPAITDVVQLDGNGNERLRSSRLAIDVIDSLA